MSKFILLLVVLVLIVFNIRNLRRIVLIPTMISLSVFNISFNLIISILIFYKSTLAYLLIYLAFSVFISMLCLSMFIKNDTKVSNNHMIATSFNSFVITLSLQYMIFLVLKLTNNMFFVYQILAFIITISLYIVLHKLLRKINLDNLIFDHSIVVGNLIIIIVISTIISLITVIDEPYNPRSDYVYLQDISDSNDYILMPKVTFNEVIEITEENTIGNYTDDYIRQYYITSEYIYTVLDRGDLGISLTAYNIDTLAETVILELDYEESISFNYINLTATYSKNVLYQYNGKIFITTPNCLYKLDGDKITLIHQTQINEGDIQFQDFHSVFYYLREESITHSYTYNYYYFDAKNLYLIHDDSLELVESNYSFDYLEYPEFMDASEKYPFAWSGNLNYIFKYSNHYAILNGETDQHPDVVDSFNDLIDIYLENNTFDMYVVLDDELVFFDTSKQNYIAYDNLNETYTVNDSYTYINHLDSTVLYTTYQSTKNDEKMVILSYSRDDYSPIISINTVDIEYYTFNNFHLQYQSKAFYLGVIILFIPFFKKENDS